VFNYLDLLSFCCINTKHLRCSLVRGIVTSQDVRLEIERKQMCALHSCIENLGNFRAFNKTCQSD
jgi:hypothetical protein